MRSRFLPILFCHNKGVFLMLSLKNWFSRLIVDLPCPAAHTDAFQLNNEAIVIEAIAPEKPGWIWFQSTSWLARCASGAMLQPGQRVYVVNRDNTTLYVELTSAAVNLDAISVFWVGL
jgi:membrane protein implicated in regulation of membrane protease activity